jgi:hypothetical protein
VRFCFAPTVVSGQMVQPPTVPSCGVRAVLWLTALLKV